MILKIVSKIYFTGYKGGCFNISRPYARKLVSRRSSLISSKSDHDSLFFSPDSDKHIRTENKENIFQLNDEEPSSTKKSEKLSLSQVLSSYKPKGNFKFKIFNG